MTLIYAHRGASGYAPENTFAAFDRAFDFRIDGIETDIRATRDGVLVLLHDATVDRTTNGQGPVAELTLAQVQALDAGVRFGPEHAGARIPTLDAFLGRYGRRTNFWLEIKAEGVEAALARAVQAHDLADRVQFTSFNYESLRRMRAAWPDARLAFLTKEVPANLAAQCHAIAAEQVSIHNSNLTADLIAALRRDGLDVRTWGIADKVSLRRVLDLGVYGLTLNWPDWAEQV